MSQKRFGIINAEGFDYAFCPSICEQCEALCCKGEGYVFLSDEDINNIAAFLNTDTKLFLKLYTKRVIYGKKTALINLKINSEIRCVFLDDNNRCEIYKVRPKQCKLFPFWESLKNKNKKQLAKLCPGIIFK